MGESIRRGFQRPDLTAADSVATTAKHLAGYGAVLAGRDYAQVEISERAFHETYLPPFKAAVDAGCPALMPAFTDLEGVPMTANAAILQDLVRGQWGFDGIYISDYNAIAASTQVVYPVWTDGRNSAGSPNGQTDIFTNVEIH